MSQQQIRLVLPKPHSKSQELVMRAFLFPSVRETYVVCGSKWGKSLASSVCLTNASMLKRAARWRWIAPIYRQSRIGMEYFRGVLPPAPHSDFVESKMEIRLPNIQSSIEFWHTQDPVSLEGAGIHGQIGDEAAKMPFQAYVSARTTTTFTRGPSMWISTPYGKNWFYKKFMEAKDEMAWAIKNGRDPEKLAIHAPTSDNPFIPKEVIEAAKKELPDRMFRQHYMAEFLDAGSVFIGHADCTEGEPIEKDYWLHESAKDSGVVLGVDWAKKEDFTVFFAIDYRTKRIVGFQRFQSIKYTEAIVELIKFAKNFKSIDGGLHDKTGVGEALDDMLGHTNLPIQGVVFTNQFKASIVNKLMLRFEKKQIILPFWSEMIKELDSFEIEVSDIGTARYNAPEGQHDDIVIALALACYAAEDMAEDSYEIKFLEDLPSKELTLDKYYRELIEENDD